jgi:hypothetical protein
MVRLLHKSRRSDCRDLKGQILKISFGWVDFSNFILKRVKTQKKIASLASGLYCTFFCP